MATLKDVAKASGLTVGTVSRVLNNRGYISDKTREKVYQVMKELNLRNIIFLIRGLGFSLYIVACFTGGYKCFCAI